MCPSEYQNMSSKPQLLICSHHIQTKNLTLFPQTGHSQNRVTASSSAPDEVEGPLLWSEPTGRFLFPADERAPLRRTPRPFPEAPWPGEASNRENALSPPFSFPWPLLAKGSQVEPGLLAVDRDGYTPADRAPLGLAEGRPWRRRENASSCSA